MIAAFALPVIFGNTVENVVYRNVLGIVPTSEKSDNRQAISLSCMCMI